MANPPEMPAHDPVAPTVKASLDLTEDRFRTLIEKAPIAIGVSRDGATIYFNQKYREMFGVAGTEELVGQSIGDLWAPESRAEILERARQRAIGLPVISSYVAIAQRKDGLRFPVHLDIQIIDLPDGPASVAFLVDITQREKDRKRLEKLNRVYAMLSVTNGTILRGLNPRELQEAVCRIAVEHGQFRMAWVGMLEESGRVSPNASAGAVDGYFDFVKIDLLDPAHNRGPSARCLLSGEHIINRDLANDPLFAPWRNEALKRGYLSSGAFPLKVDGKAVGVLNLYASDTDAFGLEELALIDKLALDIGFALEVDKRKTERESVERALADSEERFHQAQKMEAIGQLAGGVAHDFNNILAAILMQAELAIQPETPSEEIQEMLHEITRSAERAANLTRQLLAFSRRQVMQTRQVDLNDVVAGLARMLERLIGADITMEVQLHTEPLMTRADPGMLDQVLMNLAVNARDAMPAGGRLQITTTRKTIDNERGENQFVVAPGRYVAVRVTDTGCGIAPDILPRLFEPFFTTKEPGKGTGLGLATVFGIVKQHAGSVGVKSTVGEGSTFEVSLPAIGEEDGATAAGGALRASIGGTETVLLVEDDTEVRKLTRVILERAGYRVLESPNGVDAARTFAEHASEVQLLLTDIVLPEGVGGRELADKLQAANPKMRVLFTSGYSAEAGGHDLALLEGQNFVQKPFTKDQILETVRRCLDA